DGRVTVNLDDDSGTGLGAGQAGPRRGMGPWSAGVVTTLVILVAALTSIAVVYGEALRGFRKELDEHLGRVAATSAALVDGDLHRRIQRPDQQDSPEYQEAVGPLRKVLNASDGIQYIYTVVLRDGAVFFVLDA